MSKDLELSNDWIEFTFSGLLDIDSVLDFLHFSKDEFLQCPHGLYGYRSMLKHSEYHIYLMYDGSLDMGIHLRVAGHSISYFVSRLQSYQGFDITTESGFSEYDLRIVLSQLIIYGKFTRFDMALDDVLSSYFSINDIKRYLRKDQYSSKFRNYSFITGYETNDNELIGSTVYLGRRSSDIFLRIYDKKLEHDFKLPHEDPYPSPTTRWELELKHTAAHEAVQRFVDGESLTSVYFGILVNWFRLIKKDSSRKTRCSTLPLYEKFTQSLGAASISHSKKILDIDQKKSWLFSQCSKNLAQVAAADPEFLESLLDYGSDCFSSGDLDLISKYRAGNNGISDM